MSEVVRMWIEVSFDLAYLVVIWCLVVAMLRHRAQVSPTNQRVAWLILNAFVLLALGDTGHVGFRVLAYARADMTTQISFLGTTFGLLGLGVAATAVTVTLFYVLMLVAWRARYGREYGPFGHLLLSSALLRLIMITLPANQWDHLVPPQPWAVIRNVPLLVQGLGVAYLIMRDARTNKDREFWWMGVMILVSFACYMAVVLFVARVPLIGMLMIPKTVTYVVAGLLAYNSLFRVSRVDAA